MWVRIITIHVCLSLPRSKVGIAGVAVKFEVGNWFELGSQLQPTSLSEVEQRSQHFLYQPLLLIESTGIGRIVMVTFDGPASHPENKIMLNVNRLVLEGHSLHYEVLEVKVMFF